MLDVALLLACSVAMFGEWWSGRGVSTLLLMLALVPMPVVFWHGRNDAGNMWMGSTWLAAAVGCVAMAHLAHDRMMRIVIVAILSAAIVPLLARDVVQVGHEHAQTVKFFEENKQQFLLDRGWEPGSSAANIFERRLRQPEAKGWFATTNIMASLTSFGLILSIGLAIAAARAKLQSGWMGAMALMAVVAAVMVWLSGSKGAILATGVGVIVLLAGTIPGVSRTIGARRGALVIALIALAIGGVIVRGAALPESFLGDKSLLFRWHYMVSAAQVFMENAMAGVGPDGFQAAYTLHRVARNPEEVASAHSMFVDWLCTLGLAGAAWLAMTLMLTWRAGERTAEVRSQRSEVRGQNGGTANTSSSDVVPVVMKVALAVVALGMLPAFEMEWPTVDGVSMLGRAMGMMGFMVMAVMTAFVIEKSETDVIRVSLLAALATLLVHAQIEMTFVQPGAVVWCMCVIGCAGARPDERVGMVSGAGKARNVFGVIWPVILVGAALWIGLGSAIPAWKQERATVEAAEMLEPLQSDSKNIELVLQQRRAAAKALVDAYEIWPVNGRLLEAAADQLERACSIPDGPQPIGLLLEARDVIQRAIREHDRSSSMAIAVGISMRLALITGDEEHWNEAIRLARLLTDRDPNGLGAWKRLGEVLWSAGKKNEAAIAYLRALECDASFELDELKQLPPIERARLQKRVAEVGQAN